LENTNAILIVKLLKKGSVGDREVLDKLLLGFSFIVLFLKLGDELFLEWKRRQLVPNQPLEAISSRTYINSLSN